MESEINFILNDKDIHTKTNSAKVLLDYIRKDQKLTGTKEVCKEGDCGACTILLGEVLDGKLRYKTINSCLFPIQNVNGKHVVTIEGLNQEIPNLIQSEFLNHGASQCGFCTPGFVVSLTGYFLNSSNLNYDEAINFIAGNICRCTGYNSVKKSINNIILNLNGNSFNSNNNIERLIEGNILPQYFNKIEERLKKIYLDFVEQNEVKDTTFIAGGTDLFVQKPDELLTNKLFFHSKVPKLKIYETNEDIVIHSSATIEELKKYFLQYFPILNFEKLFTLFASRQIRNNATIAGNIVNASPIADITITLLALNAELILKSSNNKNRILKLDQFYKGYKTLDINSNEIIEFISIKIPASNSSFNFEKVSKRKHLDIASVNTAIFINSENNKILNIRISAGGVSPIPLLLLKTSEFLIGQKISNHVVKDAVQIAVSEISPISDIRGSKEYKTLLLQQLIKAHFIELFPQIINHEVLT